MASVPQPAVSGWLRRTQKALAYGAQDGYSLTGVNPARRVGGGTRARSLQIVEKSLQTISTWVFLSVAIAGGHPVTVRFEAEGFETTVRWGGD
jgi:hypothetical protein